jgi:SAM-dependent methyltransferase
MSTENENIPGLKGYLGGDAQILCEKYESGSFETIHANWLPLLRVTGGRAIDVGAGSGRDAAGLASRGWDVLAVEPSIDMLREAIQRHPQQGIRWIQDYLPTLGSVVSERQRFDLILCNAVWMHLDAAERAIAMKTLRKLGGRGGLLVITLRHPPDPQRHMFDVSPQETIDLGLLHSLKVMRCMTGNDPVLQWQRSNLSWSTIVFECPA